MKLATPLLLCLGSQFILNRTSSSVLFLKYFQFPWYLWVLRTLDVNGSSSSPSKPLTWQGFFRHQQWTPEFSKSCHLIHLSHCTQYSFRVECPPIAFLLRKLSVPTPELHLLWQPFWTFILLVYTPLHKTHSIATICLLWPGEQGTRTNFLCLACGGHVCSSVNFSGSPFWTHTKTILPCLSAARYSHVALFGGKNLSDSLIYQIKKEALKASADSVPSSHLAITPHNTWCPTGEKWGRSHGRLCWTQNTGRK